MDRSDDDGWCNGGWRKVVSRQTEKKLQKYSNACQSAADMRTLASSSISHHASRISHQLSTLQSVETYYYTSVMKGMVVRVSQPTLVNEGYRKWKGGQYGLKPHINHLLR